MFALSYHSRCLLCRAAFVACCLAPTTGMLLYAGWLRLPGYAAQYAGEIERQLGMSAAVASVEHPQPGRSLLYDLELTHRASGQWMARIPRLEGGTSGSTLVLIASQMELSGASWQQLTGLLDQQHGTSFDSATLSVSRLNWHVGDEIQQLEQFAARLQPGESGPVCDIRFRLKDHAAAVPVHLMLARVREDGRQLTGYEIDTGDAFVPCRLALPALTWVKRLGPRCEFSGHAVVYHGDDGWQGQLRGQFRQVDLRRLVSEQLPHDLHGLGELHIEQARFHHSRLTHASGSLLAGPGVVGLSLRRSAAQWLQLVASEPAVGQEGLLPFEELAVRFSLDAAGLRLQGICQQVPGGVLCDRHQPLLATAPSGQQLPLAHLIRALAPVSNELVPASRQTGWLLDVLPTP